MKKFLVAIIIVLWGSSVQAQSKEELLPICIEESQEIIKFAQAFRSGVSSIGETMRPSAFASMVLAPEEKELLKELLLKSITAEANPKNIELELSSGFARLETKKDLISDMLEEAFEESLEFEQMSLFIAGCTNAFGDEVYTLQEKVDELSEENEAVEKKLLAAQSDAANSLLQLGLTDASATELQALLALANQEISDLKAQVSLIDEPTAKIQARLKAALAAKLAAEQALTAAGSKIDDLKAQVSLGTETAAKIQARLTAALSARYLEERLLDAANLRQDELSTQLNEAVMARFEYKKLSDDLQSAKEQQALLLENAQNTLSEERVTSAAAQRQTELLNQQVATLRTQIQELSALLDLAEQRDQ